MAARHLVIKRMLFDRKKRDISEPYETQKTMLLVLPVLWTMIETSYSLCRKMTGLGFCRPRIYLCLLMSSIDLRSSPSMTDSVYHSLLYWRNSDWPLSPILALIRLRLLYWYPPSCRVSSNFLLYIKWISFSVAFYMLVRLGLTDYHGQPWPTIDLSGRWFERPSSTEAQA